MCANPLQSVQWIGELRDGAVGGLRRGVSLAVAATATPTALAPGALAVGLFGGVSGGWGCGVGLVQLALEKLVEIRGWLLGLESCSQVGVAILGGVGAVAT